MYYRRKFIGLLPEVNRRRLYERKGFSSIFEFAFKLAGLSEVQVNLTLRLNERFEDKPILNTLLESGAVSINKLARVAGIASSENEAFWAQQVQNLPKKALETLIKDARSTQTENIAQFDSMPGHNLQISAEVQEKLLELQIKGINLDELLLEFLARREQEIAAEKEHIADLQATTSRHIPARTKNLLKREFGKKCAIPHCKNPAQEIHHTNRYALSKSHDPYYLAPLCKAHHQIAHSIDQKSITHRIKPASLPPHPFPSAL